MRTPEPRRFIIPSVLAFNAIEEDRQSLGLRIVFGRFRYYFLSSLCLFRDLLNVISMRASGPKDLVRHGERKSGTPFKFACLAPVGASQIDAAGRWFKSPSSRSRLIRHNCAFWTSNGSHGRTLPFKPRKVMAMTGKPRKVMAMTGVGVARTNEQEQENKIRAKLDAAVCRRKRGVTELLLNRIDAHSPST